MKLGELFKSTHILEKNNWDPSLQIKKVTSDSRAVVPGDVFVAYQGSRMDGHDFLCQAIYNGASVLVFEDLPDISLPKNIVTICVPDTQKTLALLLKNYYDHPDKKMKLVGVTGTNGKTTIAHILYQLLSPTVACGYIGTLGYEFSGNVREAANTTPGPETLLPFMKDMAEAGVQYCFMEVSSHALDQCRVYGLQFELALFTQLTQDHLDYHYTMERYFQTKRQLFVSEPKPKKMLINRDCRYAQRLLEENLDAKSFSLHGIGDYFAKDIECSIQGSRFEFCYAQKKSQFNLKIPMRHNVANMMAVLGALDLLGFAIGDFKSKVESIGGVPGRLERMETRQDFDVFVDYAHTPDAFEQVLSEARYLNPKRVLTLFGCGGDRDQEKRPLMAAVAARYSDVIVMTNDNPRSENPHNIIEDMRKGIPYNQDSCPEVYEILDRQQAIDKVISLAVPGDVVFVLGKGHEDYQILGDEKIPFDDRETLLDCLKRKVRVLSS